MAAAHGALVRGCQEVPMVAQVATMGPWMGLALMAAGHRLRRRGSESRYTFLSTALRVRSTSPCIPGMFRVAGVDVQVSKEVEEVVTVPFLRRGLLASQSVSDRRPHFEFGQEPTPVK